MEIVRKICEKAEVLHESVEKFRKNCTFLNLYSGEAPYLRSMKRKRLWVMLPLVAGLTACDDFAFRHDWQEQGELRWVLDGTFPTKATAEIPDTNDFILSIRDGGGALLYEGSYGDSPQYLKVDPGCYTIGIVSLPFSSPAFARPQYGDEQVVVVSAGQNLVVHLQCTLRNAGIRLRIAPDFLTSFPDGVLFVQQRGVKLKYTYTEKRIAYMRPGEVSLVLYNNVQEQTLFTRQLEAREILTVNLSAPAADGISGGQVQVAVDTTKIWSDEDYVIGDDDSGKNDGSSWEKAIAVGEASAHTGKQGVWLYGYIVGGDLTSAGKTVKTDGIAKDTHIALAERSSVTEKQACVAVELPKGSVRDALNLVTHPELRGHRVYVKGNIEERYFGTTGLKGTSEYKQP